MRLSVGNTSELCTSKNAAKVKVYSGETRRHYKVNIRTTHQGTAMNGVIRLSAGGTLDPQISTLLVQDNPTGRKKWWFEPIKGWQGLT